MFSIREILSLSERLEENGERFYRGAAGRVPDPSLANLFRWLADEELRHIAWFSKKKSELRPEDGDRGIEEIGSDLLREILGSQTFSLEEADLSRIRDLKTLVNIAIEFEGDTILFYEMIGSMVEGKDSMDKLSEIIAEEREHIRSLQSLNPAEAGVSIPR